MYWRVLRCDFNLMLEFFAILMAVSSMAGLGWGHHVRSIADGLAIYSIILLIAQWGHIHYGDDPLIYHRFARARIYSHRLALISWNVSLWLPEPTRKLINMETRRTIFDLRGQVSYHLERLRRR
jgi:hypothetical protein